MKYVGISEQYKDLAGKWRVRVTFDDLSSTFLKFQSKPTAEEIVAEAGRYIVNLEAESARIAQSNAATTLANEKVVLVKDISLASLKAKLEAVNGVTK